MLSGLKNQESCTKGNQMSVKRTLTDYYKVVSGQHRDPFEILGMHLEEQARQQVVVARVFRPDAAKVELSDPSTGESWEMNCLHEGGFFEIWLPQRSEVFEYHIRLTRGDGSVLDYIDPYSFLPVITEYDRYLIAEGNHFKAYDKLGANQMKLGSVEGTCFAVWAPHARRVSVIGDFNHWDGSIHCMRVLGESGIWEIFIPGVSAGDRYKFEIKAYDNMLVHKADPYGLRMEEPPETASVVWQLEGHEWKDHGWMEARPGKDWRKEPMAIYEVHIGSWLRDDEGNFLSYVEIAKRLVEYCRSMGYTHVELLPVSEHPFYGSWGYQVSGYFSPSARYGTPQDFMHFVDILHQANIGVLLDWVPAHFPKDAHGLGRFDGTALYEHLDPRKGEHRDWGTLIYNYGRREVVTFLLSNLLYWCEHFHIDGFRMDAVASMLYLDYSRDSGDWVPNEYGGRENLEAIAFLKKANDTVHEQYPGVLMIAEESTAWPMVSRPTHLGGLGFDLKWNMGWMNDMLTFMQLDPIARKYHMQKLTFGLLYAYSENFILVLSHDEVVHGKRSLLNKMPGDTWQKFANLRLFYAYFMAHPGKKLLFMGGDFGQWIEWNHDQGLDWHLLEYPAHAGLHRFMQDLLALYRDNPSMYQIDFESEGFEWIDFSDAANTVVSFIRKTDSPRDSLVFIFNFTPVVRRDYRVGLPHEGRWQEIMNSDSEYYGGSNAGNPGERAAENHWWQNQPYSLNLILPPLGAVVLKPLDAPHMVRRKSDGKRLKVYTMPEGYDIKAPKTIKKVKAARKKAGSTKKAATTKKKPAKN